jgi:hypothetical protein
LGEVLARHPQLASRAAAAAAAAAAAGAVGVGGGGLFDPGGRSGRRMITPFDASYGGSEGRDQHISELLASQGWVVESSGAADDGSVLTLVR